MLNASHQLLLCKYQGLFYEMLLLIFQCGNFKERLSNFKKQDGNMIFLFVSFINVREVTSDLCGAIKPHEETTDQSCDLHIGYVTTYLENVSH